MPFRSMRLSAALFGLIAGALVAGTMPGEASARIAVPYSTPNLATEAPSAEPARPVIQVRVNRSARNRFKRQRIRLCCQKYRSGLPLKGYLCSLREVWRAHRDGICTFAYPPPYQPRGVFH